MNGIGQGFYFLRHGVTDYNQARVVMGQRDIPLNVAGRRQADRAARLLAGRGIAGIFASPLGRARETAEIVAAELAVTVTVVEALRERCWGELEGRNHPGRPMPDAPDGAETLSVFSRRVLEGLSMLPPVPGPVLLVAHSGVCRVLRRHFAIDDGEGMVPNAVPLHYLPQPGGGWWERRLTETIYQ